MLMLHQQILHVIISLLRCKRVIIISNYDVILAVSYNGFVIEKFVLLEQHKSLVVINLTLLIKQNIAITVLTFIVERVQLNLVLLSTILIQLTIIIHSSTVASYVVLIHID